MQQIIDFLSHGVSLSELVPEYCMKINEKFQYYLITTGCDNLGSKGHYQIGQRIDGKKIKKC